ncbi:hypothetical protein H5202_06105 [Shewanella sp. SG41-4]|uniref:hypothetical protein n=1 Tax=Shewanella sp. SG41-4 TaxID=2760976 RepID=UPI0015FF36D3|nr:hypothetical protein [Shewanella sp. SG41-4]MBB1438259.1 hypothetical protein [Shewanella sp. SG41-4]
MNTKLIKSSIVIAGIILIGLAFSYFMKAAEGHKAELRLKATGEWVAAEGFCNDKMKGIEGIDITDQYLLKNGKRSEVTQIEIVAQEVKLELCNQGQIEYEFEFTLLPANESFLHGSLGSFEVIKSVNDSIVYFKMNQDFKKQYENFKEKGAE